MNRHKRYPQEVRERAMRLRIPVKMNTDSGGM